MLTSLASCRGAANELLGLGAVMRMTQIVSRVLAVLAIAVLGVSDGNVSRLTAAEQPVARKAALPEEESRIWYILSQTDGNGLLYGLSERLGLASGLDRRSEPSWRGVDHGGRVELELEVEGDAKGKILIGFFNTPRWWLTDPVQVRELKGPGRHTVDRLPAGSYQIGAMIGETPRPVALGVHSTWPAPIVVSEGATTHAKLRVSSKFNGGMFGVFYGPTADWEKKDSEKVVVVRTVDRQNKPVPYCRITIVERLLEDLKKTHAFHDVATDQLGRSFFTKLDRPFSISCQRFDFVPETMATRYQVFRSATLHESKKEPLIVWKWDDFPTGSGTLRGRVHDQHGQPLTRYFLTVNRWVGARRESNDEASSFAIKLPVTHAEGRFEVPNLVPGEYELWVRHFDYPTHVFDFKGPKATVPDKPGAKVDCDVQVEAKELRYGTAVFEDGRPVQSGYFVSWYTRDPTSSWGGTYSSYSIEKDGSFRVPLSRDERILLDKNSAGLVEVHATEKGQEISLVKVSFEKLSSDPAHPTKFVLPLPKKIILK